MTTNPIIDLEKDKLLPSRRTVLILDGSFVIAYNTDKPYPMRLLLDRHSKQLSRQHLPTLESNITPYLCAVPERPDYSGALLGRLRQSELQYAIEKVDGMYKLCPNLARSWSQLEEILQDVARLLISTSHPFVSVDYQFPPLPSSFGYANGYATRREAVVAIQKSRDAFQALIAHASWGAILHRARAMSAKLTAEKQKEISTYDITADDPSAFDEGWKSVLSNPKINFHPAWLDAIVHSDVGDFSIPRSGIVIRRPIDWAYVNFISTLILSNIPVWLIWGPVKAPTASIPWHACTKERYGPNSNERQYAHTWIDNPISGVMHVHPPPPTIKKHTTGTVRFILSNATTSANTNADVTVHRTHPYDSEGVNTDVTIQDTLPSYDYTLPDNNERFEEMDKSFVGHSLENTTNKGLDVHQWILKMKELIDQSRARASAQQLQRYDQRQAESVAYRCPGKRGATVYEWDRDELNRPIRTLVTRANVEQTWSFFGDKQRWYNCVRNEWELCRELDPGDDPIDDTDSGTYSISKVEDDVRARNSFVSHVKPKYLSTISNGEYHTVRKKMKRRTYSRGLKRRQRS